MTHSEYLNQIVAEVNRGQHNDWRKVEWCSPQVLCGLAMVAAVVIGLLVHLPEKGVL